MPSKPSDPETPSSRASANARREFEAAFASHRGKLLLHCYRFTGSVHDAEDLVQETMLNAWRAYDRFEGRSALTSWLYRIATNLALTSLRKRRRARRVFPDDLRGPATRMPTKGPAAADIPWIEPLPDDMLTHVRDESPGPNAQYEQREAVRLAFIAASQQLPPRQRAALLLCDVLGWAAGETAEALGMSVPAVNSALQRARATMSGGVGAEQVDPQAGAREQAIARKYAEAWERTDLKRLLSLLTEDAQLVMPPFSEWYRGRSAVGAFLAWFFQWQWNGGVIGQFRFVPVRANGELALAGYAQLRPGAKYHARSLHVLTFRRGRIVRTTIFVGPRFFDRFGLAPEREFP